MSARAPPPREAASALLLLALLTGALWLAPPDGAGGPLALVVAVAAAHGALLSPAVAGPSRAAWGLLGAALALPALAAASYGRPGAAPLLGGALLVALAGLAGAAARSLAGRGVGVAYYPTMLLAFLAPFACGYLVQEFGTGGDPAAWRGLSPLEASARVAAGGAPPAPAVALLLAWPALAAGLRARKAP